MKKRGHIIGAGLLAAVTALSTAAKTQPLTAHRVSQEIIATQADVKVRMKITNEVGGIPLERIIPNYGMSPKEYGMRFGHGNKRSKTNYLRLSHNAKLKRR